MAKKEIRFLSLSDNWKWLIRVMQRLGHGRLENVSFVDGEPNGSLIETTIAEFRFGSGDAGCPEFEMDDFALPRRWVEFINVMGELKTQHIKHIEVKHGLPFKMEVVNLV